jgi:hypothetical protein
MFAKLTAKGYGDSTHELLIVQQVKSFVRVSVSYICNGLLVAVAHELFWQASRRGSSVVKVDNTSISKVCQLHACYCGFFLLAWKLWQAFEVLHFIFKIYAQLMN